MADEPVTAWREPLPTRLRRLVRKHQTLAATTTALVVFGLAGMAVAYRREASYSAELGRANIKLRAANLKSEFWLGETFKAFQDYYEDVGESVLRERGDLVDLRRKLLDKPKLFYERLAAEYANPRRETRTTSSSSRSRGNLGRILNMLGDDNGALEQLQSAVSLFRQLVASDPDNLDYLDGLAFSENNLGQSYLGVGRMADAEEALRESSQASGELVSRHPDVPDYRYRLAVSHNSLGNLLIRLGRWDEAEYAIERAIATFEVLVGASPTSPDSAPAWR